MTATKHQVAEAVLHDMFQQEVSYREAGRIFGIRYSYFSDLKHERFTTISKKAWGKLKAYASSGKRLREFKPNTN